MGELDGAEDIVGYALGKLVGLDEGLYDGRAVGEVDMVGLAEGTSLYIERNIHK